MLTLDANVWVAAFDPHDRFHDSSVHFLRAVSRGRLRLHGPVFATLEVACALARRTRDPKTAEAARAHLVSHPDLTLHPMDGASLFLAHELGVRHSLRGADALYAAASRLQSTRLISWDEELVQRAGAVTPESWLKENA